MCRHLRASAEGLIQMLELNLAKRGEKVTGNSLDLLAFVDSMLSKSRSNSSHQMLELNLAKMGEGNGKIFFQYEISIDA